MSINHSRGRLEKPTDRDKGSWIFLNDSKNTLPVTENPKEYFPESKPLRNTVQKHYSFGES